MKSSKKGWRSKDAQITSDKTGMVTGFTINESKIGADIETGELKTIKYEKLNHTYYDVILVVSSNTTAVIGSLESVAFNWLFSPNEYSTRRFISGKVLEEIARKLKQLNSK